MALGVVDGTLGHPRFLTGISIVVVHSFAHRNGHHILRLKL
ncbi:hypothetical protein [Desulfosporosinus sp. FKB]|nr:hypothetical protein [Desulfosporosinus sp. FKB]